MAEQVSQIKVEIDTEEAQAKLNQLYETQAKLVGEMSKVDEGSEAYKALGDSLGETNKQIGSIESNIGKQKMGINELDDVTNAASISVTNLGLAETTLGKVINSVADMVGKVKTATNAYTKAQQAANVAVNAGTKATKGLNTAMKANILIAVITMALPLILKLVDKLKGAEKETLTLADRIDMINARYERLQNILSKLGVSEITALSVEQRRLNDEIKATEQEYDRMRFNGEAVTVKQLKDLELKKKSLKDLGQQIKYLNEDLVRTNKVLEEQAKLDKKMSGNANALKVAKARLEIEKERNGYSEKYFDILKDTERLEAEGYRLQEEALDNKKNAIDKEFVVYQDRINAAEDLTELQKQQAIASRAQTVELEKQAIDIQKNAVGTEQQLRALEKQLAVISEMKRLGQENLRLTIQMNQSSAEAQASGVRNMGDMQAVYDNQNKQAALIRWSLGEWEATMKRTTGNNSVKEFFDKFDEYQKAVAKLPEDTKKWNEAQTEVFNKYQQYSAIFSQYASTQQQAVADLGASLSTMAEAQIKTLGAMYQYAIMGAEDAATEHLAAFSDNVENYKVLLKVLEDENKGVKSDDETMANFTAFLNPEDGASYSADDALNFYETLQKMGPQGTELLRNFLSVLDDGLMEANEKIDGYALNAKRAMTEYLGDAMMVGLASYREYIKSNDDYLSVQAEKEKAALDRRVAEKRAAGISEVEIAEWVKSEEEKIDKKYEAKSKLLHQNANLEKLQQAVEFANNMSSTFSALYDDNKEAQKATIVVSTIANAAMAFGSTFANAPGGVAIKAVQAAAASAAVLASGINAYRQVDAANKGTQLSGGGGSSSSLQTGTSAVSSTIIERQIQPVRTTSSSETVLVLSDVEAKQRQQQNVNKVSVI